MSRDEIHRVRVNIAGTEYTLRGREKEQRLFDIAKMVNDTMQTVVQANPNLDTKRVAVLAALNLAEELLKLRDQYDALMELLDEQTKTSS
ncbi:cell division protein ZapA [Alicyclobacillus pomorum]|jgi:cell division protein ZapA|uniref:cell division protein ZapA n=1 Tax=Alicyclobacillus pomorum TaxID=204470 RepID=UPI0004027530|nr:cell division protein ZapA [Alicyclobacillus pomorum]